MDVALTLRLREPDLIRRPNSSRQALASGTLAAGQSDIAPEITLAALWEGAARSFVETARDAGASIVAPEYVLVTEQEVRKAHQAGLRVIPWTANAVEDWNRLIAAGVDGIITDDPARLIAYLRL